MYRALSYFGHFLVLISTVSGSISISAFASLIGVPVGIASSAVELKICAITAGFKIISQSSRKTRSTII